MYRFKGKLLKLSVKKKRLPNGRVATLEVVEHPGAILVVPFLNRDKIIFVRQYRPTVNRYLYELPAGTLNKKERAVDCARRELIEEIGYEAGRFQKIATICPVPGYSTEMITIFKAERLRKKKGNKDPDEILTACVLNHRQFRSLLRREKIIDAKTVCALALCGWL